MPLSNQTALYITTQPPISLPTPLLSYQIEDSEFEVLEGELDSSTLLIENIGEEGSLLYYSVATAYPDIESPFDVTGGGPDSYGYFWSDSDLSNEINYDEAVSFMESKVESINNNLSKELLWFLTHL